MSDVLSELTEQLNQELTAVEAALAAMNLGVTASAPLCDGWEVQFRKVGAGWGLYVGQTGCDPKCHVLAASRARRVEVALAMGEIYRGLVAKRDAECGVMADALTKLRALRQDIESPR